MSTLKWPLPPEPAKIPLGSFERHWDSIDGYTIGLWHRSVYGTGDPRWDNDYPGSLEWMKRKGHPYLDLEFTALINSGWWVDRNGQPY